MCDALSPVWLSAMVAAGALAAVLLAWASPQAGSSDSALAAAGGAAIAAAFALAWPHCLGRLEQSSPELERLWLSKVREAMPIWRHGWDTAFQTVMLPFAGLVGGLAMLHVTHREARQEAHVATAFGPEAPPPATNDARAQFIRWLAITLLALLGTGLLAWQTRAGPAAQLLQRRRRRRFRLDHPLLDHGLPPPAGPRRLAGRDRLRHHRLRAGLDHHLGQRPAGARQAPTASRSTPRTAAARRSGRWARSRPSRAAW